MDSALDTGRSTSVRASVAAVTAPTVTQTGSRRAITTTSSQTTCWKCWNELRISALKLHASL